MESWEEFAVVPGSAAAALTGLLFVAGIDPAGRDSRINRTAQSGSAD